jgi:predicted amidohydrolase
MSPIRRVLGAALAAALVVGSQAGRADEPSTGVPRGAVTPGRRPERAGAKAERPPRKVVVGTVIFGPFGAYPGLDERLRTLSGLVDAMASQAAKEHPGRGLDLGILSEDAVTSTSGPPSQRAVPLRGRVQDAFAALARKHRTYLLVPLDLAEEGPRGTFTSNAAVLFDRKGDVVGVYRKAHPVATVGSDALEGGITPGRDYPVFDCDFGKLGVQICWDVQFEEGWQALADRGAEIVAWPTASPASVLPSARAARHRYFVVSSTWRNNATVYEPTGMVAARIEDPARVLVHQLDLSHAILGWSNFLENGEALRKKYGAKVGFHYSPREDMGLFWSNDPATTIAAMVRSIGGETIDVQVERNRLLYGSAAGK